jgi:hypothetical protein
MLSKINGGNGKWWGWRGNSEEARLLELDKEALAVHLMEFRGLIPGSSLPCF